MRRLPIWLLCLTVAFPLLGSARRAMASDVSISLSIGDRYHGPDLIFDSAPTVVVVRGHRGVYYVQDSDRDIYRYGHIWYMNYEGDWYRASSYRGPWFFVGYRSVPQNVYSVPVQYRRGWSDYRDSHYNWQRPRARRSAPMPARTTAVETRRSAPEAEAVAPAPASTKGKSAGHGRGNGNGHGQDNKHGN